MRSVLQLARAFVRSHVRETISLSEHLLVHNEHRTHRSRQPHFVASCSAARQSGYKSISRQNSRTFRVCMVAPCHGCWGGAKLRKVIACKLRLVRSSGTVCLVGGVRCFVFGNPGQGLCLTGSLGAPCNVDGETCRRLLLQRAICSTNVPTRGIIRLSKTAYIDHCQVWETLCERDIELAVALLPEFLPNGVFGVDNCYFTMDFFRGEFAAIGSIRINCVATVDVSFSPMLCVA